MALNEKNQHSYITGHPQGNMNFSAQFHGSPSNSWWEILFELTNVSLMVELEEKTEDLPPVNE